MTAPAKDEGVPLRHCALAHRGRPAQMRGMIRTVVAYVRRKPGATWRDVRARFSWQTRTARRVVAAAVADGALIERGEGLHVPPLDETAKLVLGGDA